MIIQTIALQMVLRRAYGSAHRSAITSQIVGLASAPSRLSAMLRPRFAGLTALTGSSVERLFGIYVMARLRSLMNLRMMDECSTWTMRRA